MKLLMIDNAALGVFYFTGKQECANFLGVSYNAINYLEKNIYKKCKGFTCEWIESDEVMSKYINNTHEVYLERLEYAKKHYDYKEEK